MGIKKRQQLSHQAEHYTRDPRLAADCIATPQLKIQLNSLAAEPLSTAPVQRLQQSGWYVSSRLEITL